MDDFPGLLARDFGFRGQGKAAPMAASKSSSGGGNLNFGIGSGGGAGDGRSSSFSSSNRGKSSWNSTPAGNSFLDDDNLFKSSTSHTNHDFDGLGGFNDVYGGPPKYNNQSDSHKGGSSSFDYDAIFQGTKDSSGAKSSSLPVYDKPVYDEDIFDGVPGMKSTTSVNYDDVFGSISSPPKQNDHYDDLLGNLGKSESHHSSNSFRKRPEQVNKGVSEFDDLIPGFGSSSPADKRRTPETSQQPQPTMPSNKSKSVMEDPFVNIESVPGPAPAYESSEIFSDPLEQFNKLKRPDNTKFNSSSGIGVFEDLNPLDDFTKSMPSFSSGVKNRMEDKNSPKTGENLTSMHKAAGEEPEEPFFKPAKDGSPKVEVPPASEVTEDSADDIWITVSEVPLFTHPTSAPPPSRPPPPRPVQVSKASDDHFSARKANEKVNDFPSFQHFSPSFQSPTTVPSSGRSQGVSPTDELEDFAMGRSRNHADDRAEVLSSEEDIDANSAAAAMKEAMDRAEAKFKHAREVREREPRTSRSREAAQQEKDEKASRDAQEQELREKREREQREKEEKERERRRLEKERERARQVVERATREARERAAAEARQKAQKENRERAERAAVQRAQAEARERAAAEARERMERAAAEAKERSSAEARAAAVARAEAEVRLRAERASVERAAAEARERAAAESRDRASAAARERQKNENDLESFFGADTRASSAPRPNRTSTMDSAFDSQFQNKPAPEGARRASPGTASTIRKASSTTNIVDDLTSIFGGGASISGEFQEIDGETDERRRARLERHQRTQERAAKALAEKNERDMQTQRDQAERHRIAETLDRDIKRWSAGKEGNLRALLSTLQYVLWPECGWQPVGLTDLITAAAVKKAYRKATLCIHPDKVQQKGANLQQKYIAEKVFDLLKEAWNKFNSEELF